MAPRQLSKTEKKRERQAISVPFIWEVRPGMPKKDWKPSPQPVKLPVSVPSGWEENPCMPAPQAATPAVKLAVSVPFGWEEKPGLPLVCFTHPSLESLPRARSIALSLPPGSSPPVSSDHEDGYWSAGDDIIVDQSGDELDELWDLGHDMYRAKTDGYSSSMTCRLANGLMSKAIISGAVPVHQNSLALVPVVNYGEVQSPTSPISETEGSPNRCITRNASLAGASFLEWLFPLLVPNSSYVDNDGFLIKDPTQESSKTGTKLLHESTCSEIGGRPLLTLGELILMSRRRNCQGKNIKIQKQQSMDFTRSGISGCFIFGAGNGISHLHRKWSRQLQQKLY